MQLTADKLQAAMGCTRAVAGLWVDHLNESCRRYEITTAARLCAYLAQIGHETDSLERLSENLNYRAQRIRDMALASKPGTRWRSLHERAEALSLNPQKMAEAVYGGRMGNAPEGSGDGWKFRGRGATHLTGRANYEAMTELVRKRFRDAPDFVENPDALLDPQWGAATAAAFWFDHGLNELADAGEFERITRRINGGTNGAEDRRARYERAKRALA